MNNVKDYAMQAEFSLAAYANWNAEMSESVAKGARLPWHYLKPFPSVIGGCCRGPQRVERSATGGFSVVV